jgi:hypothetical protein
MDDAFTNRLFLENIATKIFQVESDIDTVISKMTYNKDKRVSYIEF